VSKSIREVVAAFDRADALDAAVFALETHGFDRAAFSLLASEEAVQHKLGNRYQQVKEVEDDPKVPRDTFFPGFHGLRPNFFRLQVSRQLASSRSQASAAVWPPSLQREVGL
jgi:hypothetical protein